MKIDMHTPHKIISFATLTRSFLRKYMLPRLKNGKIHVAPDADAIYYYMDSPEYGSGSLPAITLN